MSGNGVVVASQMYLVTDANAVTRTIEIACAGPLCYAFDGLDAMSAYTPTLQPLASSVQAGPTHAPSRKALPIPMPASNYFLISGHYEHRFRPPLPHVRQLRYTDIHLR